MPTPRPCLCPPVPAECDIWWGLGSGPGWARVLPTLLGGGGGAWGAFHGAGAPLSGPVPPETSYPHPQPPAVHPARRGRRG